MRKRFIEEGVQTLSAYNPKRLCHEEIQITSNVLYKIVLENGETLYGWFDTSPKVVSKIHKNASFKTLDQLVYLDYVIENNIVKKAGKIYDIAGDVKHIIPAEMRFFRSSINESTGVIEEISVSDKKFMVNLSLPLFIKLRDGKTHRGVYIDSVSKGFINKKVFIVISPLRDSHPNGDRIELPASDILDMYNIQISVSEV